MHKYTFEELDTILNNYGFKLLECNSAKNLISEDFNGYKYKITLSNLRMGKKPNRFMRNPFAYENFVLFLSKEYPNYLLLDKQYINCKAKMRFICNKHREKGIQYNSVDNIVNNRHACKYCGCEELWERKRTKIFDLKKMCEDRNLIFENRFSKNNEIWVNYICPNHKNLGLQKVSLTHLKERISGCPFCNTMSNGELVIKDFLDNNNIDYVPQHKFDDCKNKRILSFDFYLPFYNKVIEFNGIQHYEPVSFFGGYNKFKKQVENDNIKKKYCKEHLIEMIIIKYSDYNEIERILSDELLQCNVKNIESVETTGDIQQCVS